MSDDNSDNNEDKKGKGIGGFFKKATKAFSKKSDDQTPDELLDEHSEETLDPSEDIEVTNEGTEEFTPAFNRLDDLDNDEGNAQDFTDDQTKPSFQVTDFTDEEDNEDIDKTLKNIQLPPSEHEEKTGSLNRVKSSLGSLFGKQSPPAPLHEKKEVKSSGPSLFRRLQKLVKSSSTSESKSFSQYYYDLFSPNARPSLHRNFILLLFIGSALLTARLLTTILTPPASIVKMSTITNNSYGQNTELNSSLASLERNDLFKAEVLIPDSKPKVNKKTVVDQDLVCREASRKSSLSVKLMKTIVLQDSVKSIASVQVRGKDDHLRIGDRIPGMAEIGFIDTRKLIFKNLKSGQCEYVEAPSTDEGKRKSFQVEKDLKKGNKLIANSKKTGIKNEGNTYKIKKSVRDELLGDISSIITQARAIPMKNPDGTYCFRMVEIQADSIYTKLGVQDQDIICNINGRKMESLNEAMGLMGKLKTNDRFELGITRNGSEQNFDYNFED